MSDKRLESQEYLESKGVGALLRMIATEMVIHKPNDPITFIHNLTKQIISKPNYKYSSTTVEELFIESRNKTIEEIENDRETLLQNYENTNNLNDTIISNLESSNDNNSSNISENVGLLNGNEFSLLVKALRRIGSELDSDKATQQIITESCNLLNCEGATVYTLDNDTNELILHVSDLKSRKGEENIRLPVGKGIAGQVALDGKVLIIDDTSLNPSFDNRFDLQNNFETKTILSLPLKDYDTQEIYGVIQAVNKKNDQTFNQKDVYILDTLGTQAVITLQNSMLHEFALKEKNKSESLINLFQTLKSNISINSILFTVANKILQIIECERCTLLLVDSTHNKLWSIQSDTNIVQSLDSGLAGYCARNGEILNLNDVQNDSRFDATFDKKNNFKTKNMLCIPMQSVIENDNNKKVIGVLQCINKKYNETFNKMDIELLQLILTTLSHSFEKSFANLINSNTKDNYNYNYTNSKTDINEKFVNDNLDSLNIKPRLSKRLSKNSEDICSLHEVIEEGEEEEEEEEDEAQAQEE